MLSKANFKVYVIIATYNAMRWLPNCLDSVNAYETIIVDNNSTDGTVDFIERNYPNVLVFQNSKNLGFGKANNSGLKYALEQNADYCFLLNQDAYIDIGMIETLVAFHQSNPEYGILSPIHLNGKGNRLDGKFSMFMGYDGNKDFYSDYILNKKIKEIYEVPFVNAAGWLISRDCIEKVGGFDPIFYHYGEDENYCQRVRYHNFKIGVMPGIFLKHDREERPEKKIGKKFSRFELREKEIKVRYANINEEYDLELEKLMKKRKKFMMSSALKLNFKNARFYKKEYEYLTKLVNDIKHSRKINAEFRKPYL